MGISFWNQCAQRRIQISKGKYKPVSEIIEMVIIIFLYTICYSNII